MKNVLISFPVLFPQNSFLLPCRWDVAFEDMSLPSSNLPAYGQ